MPQPSLARCSGRNTRFISAAFNFNYVYQHVMACITLLNSGTEGDLQQHRWQYLQ
jgi:hypothetical protein